MVVAECRLLDGLGLRSHISGLVQQGMMAHGSAMLAADQRDERMVLGTERARGIEGSCWRMLRSWLIDRPTAALDGLVQGDWRTMTERKPSGRA